MDLLKLAEIFKKKAEEGKRSGFESIVNRAQDIISSFILDNKSYFSREYFGGHDFTIEVIDANPSSSSITVRTNPAVFPAKGIIAATNKRYLESELSDALKSVGLAVKIS